jgi:hypothetical protein
VGCMAALGRFIARSGEKALPFFKLMKHTKKFEWTPKADKAFAELKRYLTSLPIMVAPWPREPLLLYIAATLRTPSAVFIAERDAQVIAEEKIDTPRMGAPPEEEAAVPASPHDKPSRVPSTTELLPQDYPPEPLEEVTPAAWLRCRSQSTLLALCCTMRGSATPCSKSCSTLCSSCQGNCIATSRATL